MGFLVKAALRVEAGNAVMKTRKFADVMHSMLMELKPEAVYFTEEHGKRTGYLVVELAEAAQIPHIAEPFFHTFQASVEFHPIMSPDDLMKAGPDMEHAVKQYG
ncbi:MAG: hypothetical protein NVS2B7_00830 [Herpetosiphon sp.]